MIIPFWKQWELCSINLASVISIYLVSCCCNVQPAGVRSDYPMHLWPHEQEEYTCKSLFWLQREIRSKYSLLELYQSFSKPECITLDGDNYHSFENITSVSKQGGWSGCVWCSMFYVFQFQLIISLYSLILALTNKHDTYIGWHRN